MKPFRTLAVVLLSIWCLSPTRTSACSPVMGYIRPTNYELVKDAGTIVLANALAFEKKGDTRRGSSYGTFRFKVLERIKGDCREDFIFVEGDNDIRSWGEPNDFSFTKADHGPCNPTDYQLKSSYVLFLQTHQGKWYVDGPPFTRVNVLVDGTNAPWTQAVREYARISAINNYDKEKAALHELRSHAVGGNEDYSTALVKDIDAHFSKPTPAKSFPDLRALYDQTSDATTRARVLWACARGEKQDARKLFEQLLGGGGWINYIHPICSYVAQVKLAGFHQKFVSALTTNQTEHERRMILVALAGSAESSEQDLMQNVLESVSKQEIAILVGWFVRHPSQAAISYATKLAAKDYAEESNLTFMLAGMGDTNVLNWAKEFVKRPSERNWVGYYVFAISSLPEADKLAREVIQRGDSDGLVSLIQACKDYKKTDRLELLKEAAVIETKSQKLIYWLRRTLGDWAYHGNKEAERLLSQLPVVELE